MNTKEKINYLLKKRPLLLDGAMGTQLYKYGMPQAALPEKWALDNSKILKQIHREYIEAGSDIIYSATFGANRIKLSGQKITNVKNINKELCSLAKEEAKNKCLVAGDIGPLGEFIEPFGKLSFEDAVNIFKEQVRALNDAGADLFVIETMMDIQEARAATLAVKEVCDKFIIVTMTFEASGRTLNGTTPQSALVTLQALGVDAFGANCSTGPQEMIKIISSLKPYAKVFIAAKPNAGLPKLVDGKVYFDMSAQAFGLYARKFISCGVNMFGGCCGTTPEHIFQSRRSIERKKPILPLRKQISALSSAREALSLEEQKNVLIAGESINPTGKKMLQEELKHNKFGLLTELAREQEANGASLLDVNVGVPGIDEAKIMLEAISVLAQITDLPLIIDSSNSSVIEKALRFYPGRALINSISAEKKKLKTLLVLAKKYGAMFIALPVADKKIPKDFKERKKIIKKIFKEAEKIYFDNRDIIVDALIMTISSHPNAAEDALKTITWCDKALKAHTLVGLSNVSFGLPKRNIINSSFLNMAKEKGLTLAIANPLHLKKTTNKLAKDVLLNKDKAILKFINRYAKKAESLRKISKTNKETIEEQIKKAILNGDKQGIAGLVNTAIKNGKEPLIVMQEIMIPAIVCVGEFFEKKQYFLPQLILSAETMRKGVRELLPHLKGKAGAEGKAIIILATVEGDVHDIGKNIVSLMLENHGFKIIDLGKDVSAQKIVSAIKTYKPDIVGLSALMTTTMVNMKTVIKLAKDQNLDCRFMIGGAVVTRAYADSIGANYARDGVSAVNLAKVLSSK